MFAKQDFRGARVLLTGASTGIGAALAHRLATMGARLVLAARSRDRLEHVRSSLLSSAETHVISADVANATDRARLVGQAVEALGGLDVLINNAGVGANGFFLEGSEAVLRSVFEVNFFGTTELTRLALPYLVGGKQPMIVNVSSVIGRRAVPGYTEYCSSKFAVCGWTEALRAELQLDGIHVLLVNPGLIETPFRDNLLADKLRSRNDRGRGMSPERCAEIIVRAMQRRRNEVVITMGGKTLLWLNRLLPRLVDYFMFRYARERRPESSS